MKLITWPRMRLGLKIIAVTLVAGIFALAWDGWTAFGHRATGVRLARMEKSPQWKEGHFNNPQPLANDLWGSLTGLFNVSHDVSPAAPPDVPPVDPGRFATPPASGLRITWFGHSSVLIEIDGRRILTDPVWSDRVSPFDWIGPRRWYQPPIALGALPPIDAIIISHDHFDHLDHRTIMAMKNWNTTFVVPLGVGAHLAYWGVPEGRIVDLDWWEKTKIAGIDIVATPARHASGRSVWDKDKTLWAGYALVGPQHRVYFSGDTGLFPAMKQLGDRLGPFDVTLIEAGQYNRSWPDWHIGPEQAVTAHQWVRGGALIPIHWGLLSLAFHGWTEPIERILVVSQKARINTLSPRPGQSVEPGFTPAPDRWWPTVPWEAAEHSPIVSTQVD